MCCYLQMYLKSLKRVYQSLSCQSCSSSEWSWDYMLEITGAKLDLFSDVNKFQYVENSTRGGVSYTAQKWSKPHSEHIKLYI